MFSYYFVFLVTRIIRLFEFLMFARAIFSWFPQARGSKISELLYLATEPIILPFRALFSRVNAFRGMMIDIPYLCGFVALIFVERLLSSLIV